jgi:hypothetical protein
MLLSGQLSVHGVPAAGNALNRADTDIKTTMRRFAVFGAQLASRGLHCCRAWSVLASSTGSKSFYAPELICIDLRIGMFRCDEILDS